MLLLSLALGVQASSSLAQGCVALTFDDGPDRTLTPRVLDILSQERVRATFYLVGSRAAQNPGIVRAIAAGGHEIGNHSWSHPNMTGLSAAAVASQIARTDDAIRSAAGRRPATFRPPYGAWNSRVASALDGRPLVMWDVDTQDWRNRNAARITQVSARARPGSVILMHDIHATTVAALPGVIRELKSEGRRFVRVSDVGGCGPTRAFPTTRPRGGEFREAALRTEPREELSGGWRGLFGPREDFAAAADAARPGRDFAPSRREVAHAAEPAGPIFTDPAWTSAGFAMRTDTGWAERPERVRAQPARAEIRAERPARAELRAERPARAEVRAERPERVRAERTERVRAEAPRREEQTDRGFRWGSPSWAEYSRSRDFEPRGVRAGAPAWQNIRADRETRERLAELRRDPRVAAQIDAIQRAEARAAAAGDRYAPPRQRAWQ
jgi:peptidoglycan/xylan/chitin deacetylase (PgdA/CDA1 family)